MRIQTIAGLIFAIMALICMVMGLGDGWTQMFIIIRNIQWIGADILDRLDR